MAFYSETITEKCNDPNCSRIATRQIYRSGKVAYGRYCEAHTKSNGKYLAKQYGEPFTDA